MTGRGVRAGGKKGGDFFAQATRPEWEIAAPHIVEEPQEAGYAGDRGWPGLHRLQSPHARNLEPSTCSSPAL